MTARHKLTLLAAILLALVVLVLATKGPPPPTPNPPGTFSFAALGDAPYYVWEDVQLRLVLQDLDAHDLSLIINVGDIFWHPCTDKMYRRSLNWFNALRHPVIYTPGDNEWTDCWEPGSGSFAPLDRLDRIRQIFFADPTRSLGGKTLPVVSQGNSESFPEFVENTRWEHQGYIFATVHLVGSRNGLKPFPSRTAADDAAVKQRTEAAAAWMRETFAAATARNASGVILAFHGNPFNERGRPRFEPFVTALEEEVEQFPKPVLAIHGDDHVFTVDHPLVRRTTGRHFENFTRIEVPGSPEVGWVRVVVAPGATSPFAFEEHVVPRWKYW